MPSQYHDDKRAWRRSTFDWSGTTLEYRIGKGVMEDSEESFQGLGNQPWVTHHAAVVLHAVTLGNPRMEHIVPQPTALGNCLRGEGDQWEQAGLGQDEE